VSVGLTLLLGEVLVRVFDIGPTFRVVYREVFQLSDNPVLEYELRPGARDGQQRLNSAGFRDREFPRAKPDGVFRIAAIGDSLTYAASLPRRASYAKQLEELLNAYATEGAPRFEVLNFGVTGYNITQVVERLRTLATAYDLDLVIYGYVLNDPQLFSVEGEILSQLQHPEGAGSFSTGATRLLARSQLFLMARHLFYTGVRSGGPGLGRPEAEASFPTGSDPGYIAFAQGDVTGEYFRSLHSDEDSQLRLSRGMADLARIAQQAELPVLISLFPLFLGGPDGDYPLRDVHRQLAGQVQQHGLQLLDLLPAYRALSSAHPELHVYLDFLHPNAFGYRIAALAILRWLQIAEWLPAAAIDFDRIRNGSGEDALIAAVLD
jgi:lysophospholipase L1-like esterase